jgi:zinc protease
MRTLAAALTVCLLCLAGAAQARAPIQVVTSPGGIAAWLVNEPAVPVISVRFAFKGGGALDPEGKEGLASLLTTLLDEGAGAMDALAFQTRLEELAVRLGFDADRDDFRGELTTLTRNRDAAFELLRLALNEPLFDAEPVERMRRRQIVGLTRNLEDPDSVAARAWFKAAFGEHPYWHPTDGTVEGLTAIGRDDLTGFVARRFARDNLKIAVVGDIDAATLGPLLDATFGALPAKAAPASLPPAEPALSGKLEVLRRDVPQSAIFFGLPGLKRDDPDWYTAHLLVHVLGGGTQSSRLYEEVRERRGLAYSAYAYLAPMDQAGLLLGGAGTRNDKTAETLGVLRAELARMGEAGITQQELDDARTYINGSFPLQLTSSGRIASLLLAVQMHALGLDYIERRPEIYNAITLDDVRRVAKRLLRPELLTVIVVGDPAGID